ncbi:hypothetical protein MKEN_00773400 [Mycena kentingensis (nom. inval.)]|nr:hypothetical protein MKEN_00773400 [Mycena kentingensis (nom. inval.)]
MPPLSGFPEPTQNAPSSSHPPHSANHTNSYPSPTSPIPEDLAFEQVASRSRESLRNASDALTSAYRRIRQIRRSLDLSQDLMPAMGPNHSALLLTASPVEDDSLDDGTDMADRQAQYRLSWTDHNHQDASIPPPPPRLHDHLQLPSPSPSTSALSMYPPLPRRSILESQLARRRSSGLSADDGATYLGRRIAEREAVAGSSTRRQGPLDGLPEDATFQDLDREQILARSFTRRTDPGVAASRFDALSRTDILRNARSLDADPAPPPRRHNVANINTGSGGLPHAWPTRTSRWRALTRQNSSAIQSPASAHSRPPPADRLSLLSNFSSMQNLSTPTSAALRDRPLLFEEPQSYARQDSRDVIESPGPDPRGYFIHRRLNGDGDEVVHNINLDWDEDDPLTWLMQEDSRRRRARPMDAHRDVAPVVQVPEPRRRGWARLDQDGNPIPSEEEEELERHRSEYRLRALYQARASAAAVANRVERDAQSSVEVPDASAFSNLVTRTSVSPDDGYDTVSSRRPRVRLNSRNDSSLFPPPRVGYGTVMDSVLAVDNRPPRSNSTARPVRRFADIPTNVPYGSAEPFVIDPLPMPLDEMMPRSPPRKKVASAAGWVRVSRDAGLAGR